MSGTRIRLKRFVATALLTCLLANDGNAQSDDDRESDTAGLNETIDELPIDVSHSIGDAKERRGLKIDGDFRLGNTFDGDDISDVTLGDPDTIRARWRIRSTWGITERLRSVIRVAGLCSTSECEPDFVLQPDISTGTSMEDGQVTIDEFFLQRFRSDRFNVAIGRMQVKSVSRGGVFSKSLDQNDSNDLRINWSDGLHGTFKAKNGWESHMVLQYNSEDGPSNVRRDPLDFSNDKSRVSYLFGFENLQESRHFVQRAINFDYFPSSLLANGQADGPLEDYLAIVARAGTMWPARSGTWRIRLSGEVGYAPTTPTKTAVEVTGTGDADGLAWNITASVMDFMPRHSIGINYARAGAGWLVSPQYTNNERLIEIRYRWRPTDRLTFTVRGRLRDQLQQSLIEDSDRERFDFHLRLTWSFDISEYKQH